MEAMQTMETGNSGSRMSSRRHIERGGPRSEERATWRGGSRAAAEGRDDGGVSAAAAREESAGAMVLGDGAASGGAGGRAAEREGDGDRARRWGIERWRRWREDKGEMEIDGSEEEVGLGLGLDRWADLLGGPIGQLGFSLLDLQKIERKNREKREG